MNTKAHLILPKDHVFAVETTSYPLFFLAGPMRGGADWQSDAFDYLRQRMDGQLEAFAVANPNHYKSEHPIRQYEYPIGLKTNLRFDCQLDWEKYYLQRAGIPAVGESGCIIFWLPEPRLNGPFAVNTRREVGWVTGLMDGARLWARHIKVRVVVGAEPEFDGLSEIHRSFIASSGESNFPIYRTLQETIDAAATMVGV